MKYEKEHIYFKMIGCEKKYMDDNALPDIIRYIFRTYKCPHNICGGFKIDGPDPISSMIAVSTKFNKYSRKRLHHFIVTFPAQYNCEYALIHQIGIEIAYPIGNQYQIVFSVHEDTKNIHIHFVFNAVSHIDGYKFRSSKITYKQLIAHVQRVIHRYGMGVVIPVTYKPTPADILKMDPYADEE